MMELLDVYDPGQVQGHERTQGQNAHRGQTALLEVIDRALDKGLVIESWRSVRVLGIEVLTLEIDAIVASCATYLEIAEAIEATAETAETMDQSDTDNDEGDDEGDDESDDEPDIVPR